MRLLFCIPSSSLSGGLKIIFELADRLIQRGHSVDIFSFAESPKWFPLDTPLLAEKELHEIPFGAYDYVLVSNAFLVPLVLAQSDAARVIFFCQDYESFHHAQTGKKYEDFMAECPTIREIYQLPVPIITVSRAVQRLIKTHAHRDSYYMPLGINKHAFVERPLQLLHARRRVLFVGNYLMPYKGMKNGLDALTLLARDMPIELVLATQERKGRSFFDGYTFPIEVHYCPPEANMSEIISSCDVYCCCSFYEGFGLPALEAFGCGVPVVSTRTEGVSDYGEHQVNLLLAHPNDPDDLYRQLKTLLSDETLRQRLRAGGLHTFENRFEWNAAIDHFENVMQQIAQQYTAPPPVDRAAMAALVRQLEHEGNFTPVEVFRRFQSLAYALNMLWEKLARVEMPDHADLAQLAALRDALAPYVQNAKAEYYDAFRLRYDLCQLLLGCSDDPRFSAAVRSILSRGQPRGIRSVATLCEIDYTVAQPGRDAAASPPVPLE